MGFMGMKTAIKVLIILLCLVFTFYYFHKNNSEHSLVKNITGINIPSSKAKTVYSYHESTWQDSEATFVFEITHDLYTQYLSELCNNSETDLSKNIRESKVIINDVYIKNLMLSPWDCVKSGYSVKNIWAVILVNDHFIFRIPFYSQKTGAALSFD
jgi:hypothetical protein